VSGAAPPHGGVRCDKRVGTGRKTPGGGHGIGFGVGGDILGNLARSRLVL
jgi:hypothetical protein